MIRTYAELLFATMIWGFGFIAAIWALKGMGPVLNTFLRFGLAAIFLDLIYRFRLIKGASAMMYSRKEFLAILKPGFFLFVMMTCQTWGLKYTSPARSGFITVLYVMFVPLFERIFTKTKLRPLLVLWIVLAIFGTALICKVVTNSGVDHEFLSAINIGDVLTLVCAIFGAAHIIVVNQALRQVDSPVRFNVYQCTWIALFALVLNCFTEGFGALFVHWDLQVWLGLIHLAVFSSAVAFLIQIRAQQSIPPASFGLLVLMESPWALAFSLAFGMESVSTYQFTGAGLILFAAAMESLTAYHAGKGA